MTERIKGNHRVQGILLMALTAVLWSLGGLLIKSVNIHPLAIAGIRSGISSLVLLLMIRKPKFTWSKAQIGAAISYVATVFLFVAANKTTTAANAILLQYTSPIYIALMSAWLLRERVGLMDWITVAVIIGGMAMFFFDELSTQGLLGNILAVGSGLSFATFTVCMRLQKDGSPMESVLLGNLATALIGIPFIFVALPSMQDLMYLSILGVVQLGIPYVLYSIAIKHTTALETIFILTLEPLLNPLWVMLIIGEVPGPMAIIGGAVVLVSVSVHCVMTVMRARRRMEE